MPRVVRITSADNLHVKAVVRLREHRERRKTGRFVAEGRREVERALASGLRMIELYTCPELLGAAFDIAPVDAPPAAPFEVTPALLKKVAYNQNPEGVLAVFEQPGWTLEDLASEPAGDKAGGRSGAYSGGAELWLVAVGTTKPGNLGAMVRTADAAGARGVLVADEVVDAFNPNAIRASTGAVFQVPVVAAPRDAIAAFLARRRVKLIATSPAAERPYTDADLSGPVALVIGPEDTGLDAAWFALVQEAGGEVVGIPMRGRVADSLNASAAAAVLLFEVVRQRGSVKRGA